MVTSIINNDDELILSNWRILLQAGWKEHIEG